MKARISISIDSKVLAKAHKRQAQLIVQTNQTWPLSAVIEEILDKAL